ncbi:MAG TPA: hypothetical protein DHV62_09015 [Elusimicrobia bacterium]|jgi:LCP family protein required for cell wall assembly|nr:hypothetical protein [Elusimicrobiota bacterium]
MEKNKTIFSQFQTEHYIFAIFLLLIIFSLYFSLTSPLTKAISKNETIYGLLLGCDEVAYAKHADTIIVFSYLPKEKSLNLLFIPRDTRIESTVPRGNYFRNKRINEIYAYYCRQEGNSQAPASFKKVIEEFLSSEEKQIVIPYYCQLDYSSFVKIVNLLGGIPIKIDKVMDYHDSWGKLDIHFEPGEYILNGKKALEYVRYRDESGDTERTVRQQRFLRSIFAKIKNPLLFFRLPLLLKEAVAKIQTNLSFWDLLNLSSEVKNFSPDNLRILYLPGRPDSNLWIPDKGKIGPVTELLSVSRLEEIKPEEKISTEETVLPTVTAEVWNATEQQGLALRMTRFLRRQGVDVIKWGNYGEKKQSTLIIDRTGDLKKTEKVKSIFPGNDLISNIEPERMVDVTIILGEDCLKDKKILK